MARSRSLVGRPTRGKTAPERLRRADVLCDLLRLPPSRSPLVVDVGFGADAVTTLETFRRLRTRCDSLRIIGVEIDRERVEAALPHAQPGKVDFRLGGFDLPLLVGERPGLIRAMNVLRQYPEAEYDSARRLLMTSLCEGGVLLEGTSSPSGRLLTANLWRRVDGGDRHDGVVLSVNLQRPWTPRELQTVLPKNWIHRCAPSSEIDRWFGDWDHIVSDLRDPRAPRRTRRGIFTQAAHRLREQGAQLDLRASLLTRGFLITRW